MTNIHFAAALFLQHTKSGSEFVQPEFLTDYQAWYAAVTADAADAAEAANNG